MRSAIALLMLALVLGTSAAAQEDSAFVEFRILKPEFAQKAAEAAMEACREQGYQVGVTVVDRSGHPQVFLRDRFAGPHVYETSYRKAWTAVSFGIPTSELEANTRAGDPSQAIRHLETALPLGGGLLIESAGSAVGGIGVSGAPSPELDDECAREGITAIEFDISF
ncbi:MAG: heme-binding protein [Dichotomicrobium sp.]